MLFLAPLLIRLLSTCIFVDMNHTTSSQTSENPNANPPTVQCLGEVLTESLCIQMSPSPVDFSRYGALCKLTQNTLTARAPAHWKRCRASVPASRSSHGAGATNALPPSSVDKLKHFGSNNSTHHGIPATYSQEHACKKYCTPGSHGRRLRPW